ncbi:hypothetical protein [Celeribacter halophilus]|uniref:hypothetical protein n=1 Tax=Celeribacter halophilus TaxID=576117 RepID=UPI003A91D02E
MSENYKTAKFVIIALEIFGWVIFALGIILFISSIIASQSPPSNMSFGYGAGHYLGFAFATGCFVSGLSLVAGSQLLKAQINTAIDTARIRKLMEEKGRDDKTKAATLERKEPILRAGR